MSSHRRPRIAGPTSLSDWSAVVLLVALSIWLFRGHALGDSLYIGNPDRLNSDLKVLKHYLSGLSSGHIAAWDEHEMMGYDSFALPYTFPNPLVHLVALFGEEHLYIVMGYVAIAMLAAAGIAAYCFIRADLPAGIPAVVGAICYEFSSLTLLKVSQNSMSFAVFIVIPLLALAIRHIRRETVTWCFLLLAGLLGSMLSLMFLQKAAYALMLTGAYAVWRSHTRRSWYPALIFAGALGVAVLFSLPRVIGLANAMHEYARIVAGEDFTNFEVLYDFQKIFPSQVLRWFDYAIFGRSPSEDALLGNNINLTEGFLLYTSAVTPFLLLTGLARHPSEWLNIVHARKTDAAFFFWAMIACFAVIVSKPVAHLVFLLFLRLDFTHARILIAALLPLSVLVALALTDLAPQRERTGTNLGVAAAGFAVGVLGVFAIDVIAAQFQGFFPPPSLPKMRDESLVRIGLSVMFYVVLLSFVIWARSKGLRLAAYMAICALLAGQCLLAANAQVNGPAAQNFLQPFLRGDFYYARRAEFHPPSADQLRALHERVEPNHYRVALICDQDIAGGFCAGHVPEFWQLRAVDGYYGLGVPRRLRALPWPTGVSLRTVSFLDRNQLPWDLLGLLNVRWVLQSRDGVYRNIVRDGDKITGHPDPRTFDIIPSPARVTPRVFFAGAVEPAASPEDAVSHLFQGNQIIDPQQTSFVEGLGEARRFEKRGEIELRGHGDLLDLHFEASPVERFLVVNDLYYPGWHADIAGREVPIFATNAVMRGVVVPAGANHLQMRYVSESVTPNSWIYRIVSMLIMLGLFVGLRRIAKE